MNCHDRDNPPRARPNRKLAGIELPSSRRLVIVYNCVYSIISGRNMLEAVVASYIDRYQLLPASGEVVVAVSGGADFLCLLHLLHRLCGSGQRYPEARLLAAHLNHKLRGEASDPDAAAVPGIVASWGLPIQLHRPHFPALSPTHPPPLCQSP